MLRCAPSFEPAERGIGRAKVLGGPREAFEDYMMANLSRVENTVRLYRQNLLVNFDDWLAPTIRRLAKQGRGDGRRSACFASSLNIGRANVSQDAQGEPETDVLSVALRPRQTKCRRHFASGERASHGWLARPASGAGTAERSSYLIVRRAPQPAPETRSTRPIPYQACEASGSSMKSSGYSAGRTRAARGSRAAASRGNPLPARPQQDCSPVVGRWA